MRTNGVIRNCTFATDRLTVGEWHATAEVHALVLDVVVTEILTTQTTQALPPDWHGAFDVERARRWIEDRDAESVALLAVERETSLAACFLLLFESASAEDSRVDVRIGYVVRHDLAGRGLASELVGGLVQWARTQPAIGALSGGVATDNAASARVLVKNGFVAAAPVDSAETFYELRL